jgi:glycosyltransferase involved in cell wall biosynthesis
MRPAVDLSRFVRAGARTNSTAAGRQPATGPGGTPLRVLYAGTVGLAHGLDTLLDAAAELERRAASRGGVGAGAAGDPGPPPVAVTIAGDGADAAPLRERLANGGPAGVRMLGAVPAERIPALYAESDVAVVMLRDLPIFEGALPTKLLEAMAAGKPVVLAARGEAARLVEAEKCGVVVPPEDPRALADALAALAASPSRRAALGAAGRAAAERDFGRDAWLRRWHDLLAPA